MTIRIKIILIICGIVVVLAILVLVLTSNKSSQNTEQLATPTKAVVPTRTAEKYSSDTGAQYISPSDEEYNEIQLIKILRNKVPIINDYFSIDFDYKTNKFVVKIANGSQANLSIWKQWLADSGYDQISDQYWQIE